MTSLNHNLELFLKRCLLPYREIDFGYDVTMLQTSILTYDDGPSEITPALLDILAKREIKAVFFVLGSKAEKYPEIIKRMQAEGHEIGIHGHTHTNFTDLSPESARDELTKALDILVNGIGLPRNSIVSFRPPWGFPWRLKTFYKANTLLDVLGDLNLHLVLWSYDPKDFEIHLGQVSVPEVTNRIVRDFNGGIVLLHDIHPDVLKLTEVLIDTASNNNIAFKTLSELRKKDSHARV